MENIPEIFKEVNIFFAVLRKMPAKTDPKRQIVKFIGI